MFRGSSSHTLDDKGRIIIPARFRDVIRVGVGGGGEEAVMISRMDKGLYAYTLDEWRKIEDRILSLAVKSGNLRRFRRVFIGGAFKCLCDKQGRVLIPPSLREYADLKKEIILVGVLDHFEIWSQENWNKENELMESEMQLEEVRNEISSLGL